MMTRGSAVLNNRRLDCRDLQKSDLTQTNWRLEKEREMNWCLVVYLPVPLAK
jgi:hypothetical protein